MAAPPRVLLLGCDGVLVHKPTEGGKEAARRAAHLAASREAAAAFGLRYADVDFERLAGLLAADAFAKLAQEQGRPDVDGAAVAAAKAVVQKRLSSGEPFAPGVAFACEAAAAGAALAVACGARRDHVAAVLAKTGLAAAVRAVCARDAAPDAAGRLAAAAAALGVPPAACHVLDADDATLAAAAAAGMGATDARALPGWAAAAAAAQGPPGPPRLRGTVKSYSETNHYGFIVPEARPACAAPPARSALSACLRCLPRARARRAAVRTCGRTRARCASAARARWRWARRSSTGWRLRRTAGRARAR
jgi:beta-phosphoglucomutase-like phosphatase (HAD superfamily)